MNGKTNGLEVASLLLRTRFRWRHPVYLVHALTAKCNARCGFCAWNDFESPDQLSTEEVKTLHRDAREAGFLGLSMWGGEPLLRKDTGEIFQHARDLGFHTHIITNGFLLQHKLDQVVPNIDRVCISLDHASEKHDEMRKVRGLFGRIVDATKELRRRAPNKEIIFIYTLQRDNVDEASVTAAAELMRSLDVVGIFNALRVESAAGGDDLTSFNATQEELSSAFTRLRDLKTRGYPIMNSFTHIDMLRRGPPVYRCHWPKFMLPVEANGDVVDCMHWGTQPLGNIRETPFTEILKSPRLRRLAGPEGEACHKCVSIHRVEISEVCEGHFEPVLSWQEHLSPRGGRWRAAARRLTAMRREAPPPPLPIPGAAPPERRVRHLPVQP